jgi:hypothetical protein
MLGNHGRDGRRRDVPGAKSDDVEGGAGGEKIRHRPVGWTDVGTVVQRDGGRKSLRCCRREADIVGDLERDCCAGNREVAPVALAVGERDVVQKRRGVQEFAVDVDVVDQPEGCSECVGAEGVVEQRGVEMGDSMRLGDAGEDRRGRCQPVQVELTAAPPFRCAAMAMRPATLRACAETTAGIIDVLSAAVSCPPVRTDQAWVPMR